MLREIKTQQNLTRYFTKSLKSNAIEITQVISWNISQIISHKIYHISHFILQKNILFYFSIQPIFHAFHMFAISFKYITSFTTWIFTKFHSGSKNILRTFFREILHTDFKEMAAFRKFLFAASYAHWAHSHCYNAHHCLSKSILTDRLFIASKFVACIQFNYTVAMRCIAQRDRPSLSIHCSSKFTRSSLSRNDLREPL